LTDYPSVQIRYPGYWAKNSAVLVRVRKPERGYAGDPFQWLAAALGQTGRVDEARDVLNKTILKARC